jgi:hypothetical protein
MQKIVLMSLSNDSGSETNSKNQMSLENTGKAEVDGFTAYTDEIIQ